MSRYKLLSQLGAGSMGEVWRATRRLSDGTDQDVAVKFVHAQWHDERDALERFQLEGRVGLDLHHTNIVDVYDLDSIKGRPCIVMELIDGVPLDALLASTSLSHDMVRLILRDALAGLRHAHACNILHRDLSPGNIMIGRNGIARLTDFGMAKQLRGPQTVGMLMGTLPYLAPEVLKLQEWSRGTDMYSLGAVFYYALSGRPPYEAETRRELLNAMRSQSVAPLPRAVPRDIRAFIAAALNLAPNRHDEATAAADALTHADETLRPQLGKLISSILDAAGSHSLENAPTIPLRGTRDPAEAMAAEAMAAKLQPQPKAKPRKRRLLALAIAAALIAGLAIGHQVADRNHQDSSTPQQVVQETLPPAPIEAPTLAKESPAPTEEPPPLHIDKSPPKPRTVKKPRRARARKPAPRARESAVKVGKRRPLP